MPVILSGPLIARLFHFWIAMFPDQWDCVFCIAERPNLIDHFHNAPVTINKNFKSRPERLEYSKCMNISFPGLDLQLLFMVTGAYYERVSILLVTPSLTCSFAVYYDLNYPRPAPIWPCSSVGRATIICSGVFIARCCRRIQILTISFFRV